MPHDFSKMSKDELVALLMRQVEMANKPYSLGISANGYICFRLKAKGNPALYLTKDSAEALFGAIDEVRGLYAQSNPTPKADAKATPNPLEALAKAVASLQK